MQPPRQLLAPRLTAALDEWPAQAPARPLLGVLRGEGIGPEIVAAALQVLRAAARRFGFPLEVSEGGSIGIEAQARGGAALSEEVAAFCAELFGRGGALLAGPGGGRFVYDLRRRFDLYCKFSPLRPVAAMAGCGALRADVSRGADLLLVRENAGGLYFGEESVERDALGVSAVEHRFRYSRDEAERILRVAARAAHARRRRLTLVVKPGGVEQISRLWTEALRRVADGAGIATEVLAIDNAAYQLLARPAEFDVVVSPNMFGDVLADCGALLLGSRGMAVSANFGPAGRAVYQTGHGGAHDIAGRDLANPLGQISAGVLMLRESFGLDEPAGAVERAVEAVLADGWRTRDIAAPGSRVIGTREMGERIAEAIRADAGRAAAA